MNGKNERLLLAFGEIDEKYIKEADTKMSKVAVIKVAVALVLVTAISLFLFLPYGKEKSRAPEYRDSEYYPLIEGFEEYRLSNIRYEYNNNFEAIVGTVGNFLGGFGSKGSLENSAPNMGGDLMEDVGASNGSGNGSYIEATDNQVEGVIESDLFKMTDKYIFRLGYKVDAQSPNYVSVLRVYSIEKENSAVVTEFVIPSFSGERYKGYDYQNLEMYLSEDCNTVTLLKNYTDNNGKGNIGIISLDVSDVRNIKEKGKVSIQGSLNTSRMVDGKLLLVTEYYFNPNQINYDDPSTFVPTIDSGNGPECIRFEDIIYPDNFDNTRYSVVALLDEDNLELLGANALLNFTSEVYISEKNLFISREYDEKVREDDRYITTVKSDIAVIKYSGGSLEKKGVITTTGALKDQYSFDEYEGYLRVVTTTTSELESANRGEILSFSQKQNASLYIYNLADNSLAYKVENFAIEGEEATAVRFRGDKLYVCTAVVVNFTDPVYFFDLSDYENITYTDTGIIEGYSTSLIDLGEGFLLGIGEEDWEYSKVEVYEEQGGEVVSVDEFKFVGAPSEEYKAYLVNREENIFGFAVDNYYEIYGNGYYSDSTQRYILLQFNGYELSAVAAIDIPSMSARSARAAFIDGYLYITTDTELVVERIYQ